MCFKIEIKTNSHIVIDKDHLNILTDQERSVMCNLIDKIANARGKQEKFVVVSVDEPYFQDVCKLIMDKEYEKQKLEKEKGEQPKYPYDQYRTISCGGVCR